MSTEIKPGDEIVTIQDAPTLLGYALPKGTHGTVIRSGPPIVGPYSVYARFEGDRPGDGRQVRPGDVVVVPATPAPLDPSADDALAASVQRLGKVWLEYRDQQVRGAAKALDVVAASIQQVVDAANAAHQPAPKPEWKPGTVGTATVQPFGADVRVLRSNSGRGWYCEAGFFEDAEVTGFVPDEPRPLPTRNELVKAMHDDYLKGGEPRLTVTAREHLADAVLTFLRGESR